MSGQQGCHLHLHHHHRHCLAVNRDPCLHLVTDTGSPALNRGKGISLFTYSPIISKCVVDILDTNSNSGLLSSYNPSSTYLIFKYIHIMIDMKKLAIELYLKANKVSNNFYNASILG